MMIKHKDALSFDIGEQSVKLYYNKQCIVFNSFNCPSRHKFNQFKTVIQNSPKKRYDNINDVYGLATRFSVRAVGGRYITIHKNIAF